MSVLPRELALSIERILDGESGSQPDTFGSLSRDFDPVDLLNEFFPDEESLAQINTVQGELAETQRQLEEEIEALQAELHESQDPGRMQLIQEMISDLLGQMSLIREKATESEAVVRNITKDIEVLDLAKKNLILSMTTLRRLQMLTSALAQLEEQLKEKSYAEISQSLGAVKQLCMSFKPYMSVHRISQIWKRVQAIQTELRAMIDSDFDAFYVQDPAKPVKSSTISAACSVVDVLGADIRTAFIDRYVGLELKDYRRIFRVTDTNEAGALDNVSRRFAWFRRLLQTYEVEAGRVFPLEWRVGWSLFAKFIDITREDMSVLLDKAKTQLTVPLLLDTLQQTMEFESSIATKFGVPLPEIFRTTSSSHPTARPTTSITAAFEAHMGIYIDAQDKALADMLAAHRGVKSRSSLEVTSTEAEDLPASVLVLPSSTELFYFYAQSLDSCAKLSTGSDKLLLDLTKVQGKWLRAYAEEVLNASLKRPVLVNQPRKSMETRVDINELKNACLILNTAEYCQRTTEELEGRIQEKLSESNQASVSFQAEHDLFVNVISSAILVQLRELEHALETPTGMLSRTVWGTLKDVSGPSAYVPDLVHAIESVAEVVRTNVEQKKYLRNFFDKASSLVITRFTNALVKSRPLKEIGGEQLLIDLQAVKACLLQLPGEELITQGYTRNATKAIASLEALLKVIVIPVDPPEGFILNYTLQIGDASFSNFQKILDLKGVSKTSENGLLDAFLTHTSVRPELPTTSFLSALDMHPPASALASALSGASTPVGSGAAPAARDVGAALRAALGSPPLGAGAPLGASQDGQKKEVFSDLKRLVSFGLRRDTAP